MNEEINFREVVTELNTDLFERRQEEQDYFSHTTNGHVDMILFGQELMWDSESDGREFIEAEDRYEPFLPYIKRKFNEWADKVYSLKF
jgi:hypothetical protein